MGGNNSTLVNAWFVGPNVQPRLRTMILGESHFRVLPCSRSQRDLVLGADVSHPSPGSDSPSIAALVYNSGPETMVDYMTSTRVQQARGEMIQDFPGMLQVRYEKNDIWKRR